MRLNMNNHYGSSSVNADLEGVTENIDLKIRKHKFKIAKRNYFTITLKHKDKTAKLLLNKEQIEQLSVNLHKYVSEGRHLKRTDSKASYFESKI
tara:strand:+ start:477 stop:758 length:282 start_codon:yes stop_codon:yes gene_type:complete